MTKEEKAKYFREQFYKKWGNYQNYLKNKKPKKKEKYRKRNFYLRVHGKELWISPKGSNQEFLLTDKKITMKEIRNWEIPNYKLF